MAIKHIVYSSETVDGKVIIMNNMGDKIESDKPRELLDFLGKNYEGFINRKLAWNIDLFMSSIFKKLGLPICEVLSDTEGGRRAIFRFEGDEPVLLDEAVIKADGLDTTFELPLGIYRFIYNPKTIAWLSVGGVRYASFFNNPSQYYDSDEEVNDLDFVLAKQHALEEGMLTLGLNPMKQASSAKLWEETVLKHMELPTIEDIPAEFAEEHCDELLDWCEQCMNRVWTIAKQVGHFKADESWDYDLSSAYAYALSQLKTFKYATFWKSSEMIDADYGVLKGKITINDVEVSPIAYEKDGRNIYPVKSSWIGLITLSEVQWLKKWGVGDFELDYGYFWKYPAGGREPFGTIVPKFYNLRWQEGMVKSLAKKMLSASWGKFIWKKAGEQSNPYCNPIFALQVQTATRLRVASFIYHYDVMDKVVHIGTDGVRLSEKVDIPDILKLGGWRMNEQMPCIVLSPGEVFAPDRKPGGLYYDDVVGMINEKPKGEYYTKEKQRRRTLTEAVQLGNISEVGEVRDYARSFHITTSQQDHISYTFSKYPKNGKELLENKYYGEPVSI